MLLILAAPPATLAADFDALAQALANKDWSRAAAEAGRLDHDAHDGDFFAAYVAAARLVSEGRCAEAAPVLAALSAAKPYFVPAYELGYACDHASGNRQGAAAELQAMLAILPEGPQRDLVAQLLQRERAADHPALELHGAVTPTNNANRATAATHLPGSDWTITERATPGLLASAGTSATFDLFTTPDFAVAGVLGVDLGYSSATNLFSPTLSTALPMSFGSLGARQITVSPFISAGFDGLAVGGGHAGIKASLSQPLSPSISAVLTGSLSADRYFNGAGHDGVEGTTDFALAAILDPATQLSGRFSAAYDHTLDPDWRTLNLSLLARVDRLLPAGIVVAAQATVGVRFHSAPPAAAPSGAPDQRDLYGSLRLELADRHIAIGPFLPVLYYQYQRQFSDNVFYAFDAQDIGITLRAKF